MAKWGEIKCPRCEMLEEHLCLTEERLEAAQRDAKEAEAYADELEAKLAKAVEALDKIKRTDNLVGVFAACERTLAELTGGKDE